jgi:hypothetical protein
MNVDDILVILLVILITLLVLFIADLFHPVDSLVIKLFLDVDMWSWPWSLWHHVSVIHLVVSKPRLQDEFPR